MKRAAAGLALGIILSGACVAGELTIGGKAPAWKELPGTDGKKHSLADLADAKAVAVIFFANHCPDCGHYLDRILAVANDYKDKGVACVLICVTRMDDDSMENMAKLAKEKKLACQYLKDESQNVGRAYGAAITPEVFLLDGERRLAYRGAVDDHHNPEKVKRQHLRAALDEVLGGKKVSVATTEAVGCDIEYEKEKKK